MAVQKVAGWAAKVPSWSVELAGYILEVDGEPLAYLIGSSQMQVQVITHAKRRMELFDEEEGSDGDEYGGSLSVLWLEDRVQLVRLSKRVGSGRMPFMKTYWMGHAAVYQM